MARYVDATKVKEILHHKTGGCMFDDFIDEVPTADVVNSAWAKALEKDVEIIENKIIKVEAQRDALLKELQRLADCSSCKFNAPDAVDGCSVLMPCKDGSMWEWKGDCNETR